ncbi:hypothetical protein H5410_052801 [Solanum commersonii]|uniref:RNase H type-1 domain-containing protein n=1 Tax=Solanum commersonii TaxID=4109 RepID=A0A9J5X4M9_SOLCO|nr:hypothetical protein H5410_052801 [Solanum commersonii]
MDRSWEAQDKVEQVESSGIARGIEIYGKLGLRIALERGLVPLEVNVDCKEIKTLIRGEHPTYENIVSDCRDLLHRLGNPQYTTSLEKQTKWQTL